MGLFINSLAIADFQLLWYLGEYHNTAVLPCRLLIFNWQRYYERVGINYFYCHFSSSLSLQILSKRLDEKPKGERGKTRAMKQPETVS